MQGRSRSASGYCVTTRQNKRVLVHSGATVDNDSKHIFPSKLTRGAGEMDPRLRGLSVQA